MNINSNSIDSVVIQEFFNDMTHLRDEVKSKGKKFDSEKLKEIDQVIQEEGQKILEKWEQKGVTFKDLTDRIHVLSQTPEGLKELKASDLEAAISGIAVLMHEKQKLAPSSSLKDFASSLEHLVKASEAWNKQIKVELSKSDSDLRQKIAPSERFSWLSWSLPNLGYFGLRQSLSENTAENENVVTDQPQVDQTKTPEEIREETIKLLRQAYRFTHIDKVYSYKTNQETSIPRFVHSLLVDPNLNARQDVSDHGLTLSVPTQFWCDLHRCHSLTINGEDIPILASFDACVRMRELLPEDTFYRLGTLVSQAYSADILEDLMHRIPDQLQGKVVFGSDIGQKGGIIYNIQMNATHLHIQVKLTLAFRDALNIEEPPLGYISNQLDIKVPLKEFNQDLDTLQNPDSLPELEARLTYSGLYNTPQKAEHFLKFYTKD